MASNDNPKPNDLEPTKPLITVDFQGTMKLTSTNYAMWKTQIKTILTHYGLFKFLDGTHPPPPKTITKNANIVTSNPDYITWMRQDQLLFEAIVRTIASNLVGPLAIRAKTSGAIWKILEETYAKPSREHISQLKHELGTMKKGNQTVTEFMQQIIARTNLLAERGERQDPKDIITCVLNGLDPSFEFVADELKARGYAIGFEEFYEMLVAEELENECQWCREIGHVASCCPILFRVLFFQMNDTIDFTKFPIER